MVKSRGSLYSKAAIVANAVPQSLWLTEIGFVSDMVLRLLTMMKKRPSSIPDHLMARLKKMPDNESSGIL